jgi:hypothetical protein
MATNPNPARITDASWWLMEQLLGLQPGTQNGGIYADKSGYHNTRAANEAKWPSNYSIREAEDQGGPDDKAAACDWTFPDAQGGNYVTISRYFRLLLASGQDSNDPRLDGWRECFGQADNDTEVEGWDFRHDRTTTSDNSHLWHIHLSEDRDKVASYDNKKALLSVLKGETVDQWRQGANTLTGSLADINGDGHVDVLARWQNGDLYIYPGTGGTGTDTFGEKQLVGTGWNVVTAMNVADINGDGHVDILARWQNGDLYIYPGTGGTGTDTFGEKQLVGTGWNVVTAIT